MSIQICNDCKYRICQCNPTHNIYGIPLENVDMDDLDEVEQAIIWARAREDINMAEFIGFNITWRAIKTLREIEHPKWD